MMTPAHVRTVGLLLTLAVAVSVATAAGPPKLLHASLLNAVHLLPDTGELSLDSILASNFPEPAAADSLSVLLSTAEGIALARYTVYPAQVSADQWSLDFGGAPTFLGGAPVPGGISPVLQPGSYRLDFLLGDATFYRFPFTVTRHDSAEGKARYYLEGDWNDWGYVFYANGNPDNALQWKIWLRARPGLREEEVRPRVEILRERDGVLFATDRPDVTLTLNPGWIRYAFDMITPMQGTSGGAFLTAQELLSQDGAYTLSMSLGGQPYGTWRFQVQQGKLDYTGRAAPSADPLSGITSGEGAWWYARQTSATPPPAPPAPPPTTPPAAATTAPPAATTAPPVATTALPPSGPIPGARPLLVNGSTLVPLRAIFEWLGAEVKFDSATQTITAVRGERRVELTLGQTLATVNGQPVRLTTPAMIQAGSTYVPLRFVGEAMGAEIKWDAATQTITIVDGERVGTVSF